MTLEEWTKYITSLKSHVWVKDLLGTHCDLCETEYDKSSPYCLGWRGSTLYFKGKIEKEESNECSHDYVTYTGFNESFQYCKKCDHKKGA